MAAMEFSINGFPPTYQIVYKLIKLDLICLVNEILITVYPNALL